MTLFIFLFFEQSFLMMMDLILIRKFCFTNANGNQLLEFFVFEIIIQYDWNFSKTKQKINKMNLLERRNKFYPFNTNIQHDWWWWWECVTLKHVNKENFFYHVHVETLTVFGNDSKIIWWKQQFTNQFPYIQCVWFFF